MPNYVPIQDLPILTDLSDTDYIPVSDGETAFAIQVEDFKAYDVDPTLTESGYAADAKATGDRFGALQSQLEHSIHLQPYDINQFLLQDKAYFDPSTNSIKTHNNYCLFYVPIDASVKILQVDFANNFWGNFSTDAVFVLKYSNNTSAGIARDTPNALSNWKNTMVLTPTTNSGIVGLYITANRNSPYIDNLRGVYLNTKQNTLKNYDAPRLITELDHNYYISSDNYYNANGLIEAPASSGYNNYWIEVESGDTIYWIDGPVITTVIGNIRSYDGTQVESIPKQAEYTVTLSGIASLFCREGTRYLIKPANSSKIYYQDVLGLSIDPQGFNQFSGMSGVAFGTSLTYRAQTTGGYLTKLSTLSGITFDNQGIGSATILKMASYPDLDILARIKSYQGYADKRVCILEGFVNDWGENYDKLGTYTDSGETTVCGCVRSALNYILSQNPDITVFLVLDHYGRNYNNVDSSSTGVNSDGKTQYYWWEEIAKVAESLAIPVIKEYAISGISENTPQYLMDNIHCSTLGAEQSANAIWSVMRQHLPNEIASV